ncbi:hypothetical protein Ccrd_025403 [Cynara cardunculus var. scolymus]|uniref:Uncharacterized protein n=1 Tax=Cynara cardunculus var. scolymus TaxID=59895 RepID=A0A124SAX1_CYNCS|nr:hypothetical protein Ccrd_025403 [Cynara cardunculus var. scolymus]
MEFIFQLHNILLALRYVKRDQIKGQALHFLFGGVPQSMYWKKNYDAGSQNGFCHDSTILLFRDLSLLIIMFQPSTF